MTRYTKLEKKKYEKAAGFEGYNIKPLQLDKVIEPEVTGQKNKRKIQDEKLDSSINKFKKKRKLYKKIKNSEEKNDTGIYIF
jgi:hypothetical protein